jgi:hypothetical protein
MEQELWKLLYTLARQLDKRQASGLYRPSDIVGVALWAVLHDRPIVWATLESNWPQGIRLFIPSQSTMSRRLQHLTTQHLMHEMEKAFLVLLLLVERWVKIIDAKPLPVGGHSKDPDAHWGHGVRGYAKGYKLFAIYGEGPLPLTWRVAPMNAGETTVAQRMLPDLQGGGYLLGDKRYDSNSLYAAARRNNHQLVAPRQRPGTGLGHRPHDTDRLRAMELLQTAFGKALIEERNRIEQDFAHLTNFGGGLAPLPNWVRREHRVRLWVQAKILIYAAWLQNKLQHSVLALA